MKIGILTFHFVHNYGAVLQAYALQRYLQSLGYDVEFVDYRPEHLQAIYRIFPSVSELNGFRKLLRITSQILTFPVRYFRHRRFEHFISEYFHLSETRITKGNLPELNHDVYITGSDQIWNPDITKGFDDIYFAHFGGGKSFRRVAYAASMGVSSLTEKEKEYLSERLPNFSAIGIRENILKNLLQPLVASDIKTVLDPTFLLNKKEWEEIAIAPDSSEKYVLIYQVCKDPNILRIARQIADQLNAKVIEITAYPDWKFKFYRKQCVSPEKFIGYFKNAACVVTSSFHGTAFSIIFNRPVYVVDIATMRNGSNSRLQSLLTSLKLQSRYIRPDAQISYTPVDYTETNAILENLRDQSINFLKKALSPKI